LQQTRSQAAREEGKHSDDNHDIGVISDNA
jgi:hypothetical protein